MSQKWLTAILILVAIPIILAVAASRYFLPSPKPYIPPKANVIQTPLLPITTKSTISGWSIQQSILPQPAGTTDSDGTKNQASYNYWTSLNTWGVFKEKHLAGINNTSGSTILKKTAQASPSAAFDQYGVTAKAVTITLTDKIQPMLQSKDDKAKVVTSVGEQFNKGSGELTIFIHISPDLLNADPKNADYLSPRASILYLTILFQLTHPDATIKESEDAALVFFQDQLSSQSLFSIRKI